MSKTNEKIIETAREQYADIDKAIELIKQLKDLHNFRLITGNKWKEVENLEAELYIRRSALSSTGLFDL